MRRVRWMTPLLVTLAALALMLALSGALAPAAAASQSQLEQPLQLPFNCAEPPTPERPGDGFVGSLDPPTYGVGIPGSVYSETSYAGLVWHTYDNCAAIIDTAMGNFVFKFPKVLVAAVNYLHYLLADGGGLDQLDGLIESAVKAMYENVFSPYISLALLLLGVFILALNLRKGMLADSTRRLVMALMGLLLASLSYATPVTLSQIADTLLIDELQAVQRQIVAAGGVGNSRDSLPTALVDVIIYDNWLRGEFGSLQAPEAEQFGRRLLLAQAFSKAEIAAEGADTLALVEAKQADFRAIAGQLGTARPYFTGQQSGRIGASILAFLQAVSVCGLQIVAQFMVLLAMLGVRLLVVFLPALAVIAAGRPSTFVETFKIVGQMLFLTIIMGAAAALHALLVLALYQPDVRQSLGDLFILVILFLVECMILVALHPIRKLRGLIEGVNAPLQSLAPKPSASWTWLRKRLGGGSGPGDAQTRWWDERKRELGNRPGSAVRPERPESEAPPHNRGQAAPRRQPPADEAVDDGEIYRPGRPPDAPSPPTE